MADETQTQTQTLNIGGNTFSVNEHGCIATIDDARKAASALVVSGILSTLNGKDTPKRRWAVAMLAPDTIALWRAACRTRGFTLSQGGNTYTLAAVASGSTRFDPRESFTVA